MTDSDTDRLVGTHLRLVLEQQDGEPVLKLTRREPPPEPDEVCDPLKSTEGRVLTGLLLREYGHPRADDADFRSEVFDKAHDLLDHALSEEQVGINRKHLSFLGALQEVERDVLASPNYSDAEAGARLKWQEAMRQAYGPCR